tara:strand:+ start:428 stop:565 length:138 start_codon:yes stop_codon:yes gene_type:complete
MQVITTTTTGETITYGYDPEHHDSVLVFYQELKDRGDLVEYRIAD